MVNLPNFNAEIGADYIGDDAQPALTFRNTGSGPGLRTYGVVNTSGASVDFVYGSPVVTSNVTTANVAQFTRTVIGAPSVALAMFSVSGASVPVLEFQANAIVSCVSIVFAASGNWAGTSAVRVKYSDGTTYGWIPVLPSAVVTVAAI